MASEGRGSSASCGVQLDAVAVARLAARALEILEAHQRLAEQAAGEVQQAALCIGGQLLGVDAGTAAERLAARCCTSSSATRAAADARLACHRLGEAGHALASIDSEPMLGGNCGSTFAAG